MAAMRGLGLITTVTIVAPIRSVCDLSARERATSPWVAGLTVGQWSAGQLVIPLTWLYICSII